jgi:5-methylthioadenosine/S-adenosylhomocysteine deaminase
MATPADLLVRAARVLPMTGPESVIHDGAIAVRDARILAVGPAAEVTRDHTPAHAMDLGDAAVLPGFVDVHAHVPQTFLHGRQAGVFSARPFIPFLATDLLSDDRVHAFGLVGCLEALRYGTTTIQASLTCMAALAEAVAECGIRAVLAEEVCDMDYRTAAYGDYVHAPGQAEAQLAAATAFARTWHGRAEGRVRAALAPLAPDMVTPRTYRLVAELAQAHDLPVVTHAAQSAAEVRYVAATHGKRPIEYLAEAGLLGPRTVLAHCLYASEAEIDAVRRSRTPIAHCPRGFLLDGLTAALDAWLESGIRVGLGTDDVCHSMWETMLAARYAAAIHSGARLTGYQLLEMATSGGAAVLGMADEIGKLTPGARADLQVVAIDGPEAAPAGDLAESLLTQGAANVRQVFVDGRIVYGPGRQTTVDVPAALARARQESDRLWRALQRRINATEQQAR